MELHIRNQIPYITLLYLLMTNKIEQNILFMLKKIYFLVLINKKKTMKKMKLITLSLIIY